MSNRLHSTYWAEIEFPPCSLRRTRSDIPMIRLTSETRKKLRHIANFALIGATLTGVVVGRTDLPYDPRDIVGLTTAALAAIWIFRRR